VLFRVGLQKIDLRFDFVAWNGHARHV